MEKEYLGLGFFFVIYVLAFSVLSLTKRQPVIF